MASVWHKVLLWMIFWDVTPASAMFHNKKSGDNIFESPTKRLRQHVHTLFLDNKLSGQETQLLENQIGACHVQGFKEHAGPSVNVSKKAARDMLRRCLKGTKWPKIYTAEIRIWDAKLQVEKYAKVALLLPHELLHVLGTMNSAETLTQLDGAVESVQAHCRKAQRVFGSPTCGFGLWSDATPFNWDRTKTLEIILISFPGLEPPHHTVRIPVCAIPHELVLKEKTFQDIFSIIAWSFQCMAIQFMPNHRHDGSPWCVPEDNWRKQRQGLPLPCPGVLAEVRCDWKCQAEVFGLPSWQQKACICCKCSATLETFTDFTSNAVWRTERYSHWDFLEKLESLDRPRTALYKCPFFTTEVFKLDWLHVADLGCSCDMLGNLLWYVLPKFGGTRQEQLSALWLRMKIYYADCAIQDTIGNLTFGMLRKKAPLRPS